MNQLLKWVTNTGDIVWGVDQDHRIIFWNAAASIHLGYSEPEAIGTICHELLQGCNQEGTHFCQEHCHLIQEMNNGKKVEARDMLMRHAEGHVIPLNLSTMTVPNELHNGLSLALIHMSRPITKFVAEDRLRIHFLGPFTVTRPDGTTVSGKLWHRTKVRALMAFLSIHRGIRIHRDLLIELLWPDLAHESALQNLNATVYKLRRSLEPELALGRDSRYIHYESSQYWLDSSVPHWIDIDIASQTLNRARKAPNMQAAIAAYERVRALQVGPFLMDLTGTAVWSAAEDQRYHVMAIEAMERLATLYQETGELAQAYDMHQQILMHEPLHEPSHQQILTYMLAQGDRNGAITHYRQFHSDLQRELGIHPSKTTLQLYQTAQAY